MKIIYPERIEEFADLHPDAKAALERWSAIVKAATWKHHADLKKIWVMVIKSEKEYKDYEARVEKLMQRCTELGDMELLTEEEKAEFMRLREALDEYGSAYHPLPGQMSSLLTDAILSQVKEKGLKQKDAARMIGISSTMFSDLIHGRRSLSFEVARSIHKVLGIPAEVVLA